MNDFTDLEIKIGYTFKNKDYLLLALTHSSYANEYIYKKFVSNERIEFLGDSVLNIVISSWLYKNTKLQEGEMTKSRASIVCEDSLAECARSISLGSFLLLGNGEINSGGKSRTSILSDAFEALIGAIYIDQGLSYASDFILKSMKKIIDNAVDGKLYKDYKTILQELLQKNGEKEIRYEIINESGPDHNKRYVTQVIVDNKPIGQGEGKSKKESEQNAAMQALKKDLCVE